MDEKEFRKMIDNDQTIRHMIANINSNLTTISTFCQRIMDLEKKIEELQKKKIRCPGCNFPIYCDVCGALNDEEAVSQRLFCTNEECETNQKKEPV